MRVLSKQLLKGFVGNSGVGGQQHGEGGGGGVGGNSGGFNSGAVFNL